jgi:flagellar basal-body rod protein FlgB
VFGDITDLTIQSALNGLALRQRVIADNVANIQTPGFLAGRVQFEAALASAVASGSAAQVASVTPAEARSLEPTNTNGNNVNLDHETLSNTDTVLRYQLMLRAADDQFGLVHTAIGGAA